ncbi:MAG: RNA methyltransferase [Clostridia bacterium]|nr:RNA methyltransferase [Clostridia bacterium]
MPLKMKRSTELISSKNNPLVIRLAKLEEKKYREEEHLFRLDGIKLMLEALAFGAEVEYILVREDSVGRVESAIDEFFHNDLLDCGGVFITIGGAAFSKLSSEKSPEGVITVVRYAEDFHVNSESESENVFSNNERILFLESVRDPGNLGTIMRSGAAFGIDRVILSRDCADIYNPKTLRAAMGALFKVRSTRVYNVTAAIEALTLSGRRVFAAALDKNAMSLGSFEIRENDVFLIGNEGHGLSPEAFKAATGSVFIPMAEGTESLNAAVAASVCLWESSKIQERNK